MRTKLQMWGNSLALRIPKGVAEDAGLAAGAEVDVMQVEDRLVVQRVPTTLTLERLLDGVTTDNVHGEVGTGDAVGREAW